MALPLILGAVAAMIFANTIEDDYSYYFGGKNCCGTDTAHRMLGAAAPETTPAGGSYNCAAFGGDDAEAAHRMLGGDADAYAEPAVFANYCVKCCVEAAHRMLGAAPAEGNCGAEDHEVAHRMLAGGPPAIVFAHGCDRYLFSNCALFGEQRRGGWWAGRMGGACPVPRWPVVPFSQTRKPVN